MNFEMIVPAADLDLNVPKIKNALESRPELLVFDNNRPQFVLLTIEQYEAYTKVKEMKKENMAVIPESEKIGRYVQDSFRALFYGEKLTDSEIERLQKPEDCKLTFGLSYPVLKEVDENTPIDDQKRDKNGYNRYYGYPYKIRGKQYLLCSQWVERIHRERLESWLSQFDL